MQDSDFHFEFIFEVDFEFEVKKHKRRFMKEGIYKPKNLVYLSE